MIVGICMCSLRVIAAFYLFVCVSNKRIRTCKNANMILVQHSRLKLKKERNKEKNTWPNQTMQNIRRDRASEPANNSIATTIITAGKKTHHGNSLIFIYITHIHLHACNNNIMIITCTTPKSLSNVPPQRSTNNIQANFNKCSIGFMQGAIFYSIEDSYSRIEHLF